MGYGALKRYLQDHPNQSGYFLETAHPLKFYDVVEKIIPGKTALTSSVKELLIKEKKSEKIKADAAVLKAFLLA